MAPDIVAFRHIENGSVYFLVVAPAHLVLMAATYLGTDRFHGH